MKRNIIIISILMFAATLIGCKGEKQTTENKPSEQKVTTQNSNPYTQEESAERSSKSHQHLNTGGLEWMNMDQLAKIPMSGSKLYLIDIYTEWCGWCKIMDKKTFSDEEVQTYLSEHFHLIKFNAERKDTVTFNGRKFGWKKGGRKGTNELALELLNGRMTYPSLVFLDQNLKMIKVSAGYKNPQQLLQELEIVTRS